jgi:hypothetical protein
MFVADIDGDEAMGGAVPRTANQDRQLNPSAPNDSLLQSADLSTFREIYVRLRPTTLPGLSMAQKLFVATGDEALFLNKR